MRPFDPEEPPPESPENEHARLLLAADGPEVPNKGTCTKDFALGAVISVTATISSGTVIYGTRGSEGLFGFAAAYLMEVSLSMDNMFAFFLIFRYYKTPMECQAVCLFWGIAGAVMLRAFILLLGTAIVQAAKPLMLGFAGLLLYSSYGMITSAGSDDDDEEDLSNNRVVRFVRWLRLPVTSDYVGTRFIVFEGGTVKVTPLVLVLATIELSDIVFAADSVPAVLGLSSDMLCVYVAVICAILGLRTIYSLTVILIKTFHYLQHAVSLLLAFIGVKIVIDVLFGVTIPTWASLLVIVATLGAGMLASACPSCHLSGAQTAERRA